MLDTEMSKEDHYNRIVASISGVEINKISSGKFGENPTDMEKVQKAVEELKSIPYHYISIAGQSFENILAVMRKWIYQHVGFDENGRTKDCLIVYDYLKLMGSEGISASMQEYQVLGFQITKLHNFCVKYDVPLRGGYGGSRYTKSPLPASSRAFSKDCTLRTAFFKSLLIVLRC